MKAVISLFLFVTTLVTSNGYCMDISFNTKSLQESQILQYEIAEIQKLLPPVMREVLATSHISITVSAAAKNASMHASTIVIPKEYLNVYNLNNPVSIETFFGKKKSTHFKDMNTLLRSSLVHEMMHIFDERYADQNQSIKSDQACQTRSNEKKNTCANFQPLVSNTRTFLNVFNWHYQENTGNIERGQFDETRSPAIYEFENSAESLAVHMEYFTLDKEYKCRFPSKYQFFKKLFNQYDPYPKFNCSEKYTVVVKSGSLGLPELRTISLASLYEVHYLWAGPGPGVMSRQGHAMYRLVFCPPGETPSKSCRSNLKYQLAVNFIAEIPSDTISSLDGLTGVYPLVTSVKTLTETVHQYNDNEFRDVYSLPLKLSTAQKKEFLERVVERNWTYEGRYYFLSRNCATEALLFLKAINQDTHLKEFNTIKPDTLFSYLRSNNNLSEKMTDQELMDEEGGLFFSSSKKQYTYLTAFVGTSLNYPGLQKIEDYSKTSVEQRGKIIDQALRIGDPKIRKALVSALMVLERREAESLNKEVIARIKALTSKNPNSDGNQKVNNFFTYFYDLRNASSLIGRAETYGVANDAEIQSIVNNSSLFEHVNSVIEARDQYLSEAAKMIDPKLFQDSMDSNELVSKLKKSYSK